MKYFKLTQIVPFLFICSYLYQYAYWTTFSVDAIKFIQFTDLIQISILPVFQNFGFLILIILALFVDVNLLTKFKDNESFEQIKKYNSFFFIVWLIGVVAMHNNNSGSFFFPIWGCWFPLLFSIYGLNIAINTKFDLIKLIVVIMLPFMFYSTAKNESSKVHRNLSYTYIDLASFRFQPDITTLNVKMKVLAIRDEYFICTDMENKQICYIPKKELPIKRK